MAANPYGVVDTLITQDSHFVEYYGPEADVQIREYQAELQHFMT